MKQGLIIGGMVALCSITYAALAYASTVEILNDNKKDLEVVIEGGEGTIMPNKQELKYLIKKGGNKKVQITDKEFPDDNTFTITGKVNTPSLYNKCGPMWMDKDYIIVFSATSTGATACHYAAK